MLASFYITSYDEVEGNDKYLHERLILANKKNHSQNYGLVKHLLQRLEDKHAIEGGELEDLKLLSNMKSLELIKLLNEEAYRKVYKLK